MDTVPGLIGVRTRDAGKQGASDRGAGMRNVSHALIVTCPAETGLRAARKAPGQAVPAGRLARYKPSG